MKNYPSLLICACIITGLIMILFDMYGWGWAIGLGFLMAGLNGSDDDA